MKKLISSLVLVGISAGCGYNSAPVLPLNYSIPQNYRAYRAAGDLVEVPGFQAGDKLKLDGPLWFDGTGKVYLLTPDAFKVELDISGYHYMIDAKRVDSKIAHLVVEDLKNGTVEDHDATYSRTGNSTHFEIGKGEEIENFTIDGKRPGYFELEIKQPDRTIKLKVTKG